MSSSLCDISSKTGAKSDQEEVKPKGKGPEPPINIRLNDPADCPSVCCCFSCLKGIFSALLSFPIPNSEGRATETQRTEVCCC